MSHTNTITQSENRGNRTNRALRDHYQEVTDRIIAALEAGTPPCRRPRDPEKTGGPPDRRPVPKTMPVPTATCVTPPDPTAAPALASVPGQGPFIPGTP